MPSLTRKFLIAAVFLAPFMAAPAFAAGDDSDTTSTPDCPKGQVWDKEAQKCVDPEKSTLDTDSIYEYGRKLAMEQRYGEAIEVLSLAADRGDARVFNYLGYSHRKQGRVTVGLGYYEEALAIDPDFTLAREYMGEAYLQIGDLKAARNQLAEIADRCGASCEEYGTLETLIADHRS